MDSSNKNHVPSRPAQLSVLKEALDNSSDKNRNFMIAFFLLQLYLFITVLSTTDLQLLLLNSKVDLPLIGIPVSLKDFVTLAPGILIAFYYNLLFNLYEHVKTLQAWLAHPENDKAANFNLLHPFMFNTRAKYDSYLSGQIGPEQQKRTRNYHLLNVIIIGTIAIFPMILLVFICWKYASYQNYLTTSFHVACICFAIFLHIVFWLPIQYPQRFTQRLTFKQMVFMLLNTCKFETIYLSLVILIITFRIATLVTTDISPQKLIPVVENRHLAWLIPHIDVSSMIQRSNSQSITVEDIRSSERDKKTKPNNVIVTCSP